MGAHAHIINDGNPLSELVSKASSCKLGGLDYDGEVTPEDALELLQRQTALLVDVRTDVEWNSVGLPDVSRSQGTLATISWKLAPNMVLNGNFLSQLAQAAPDKSTPIFFLCRSGGRSLDAAVTAKSAGYQLCFNVTGGFEGSPDHVGWKAANLPCKTVGL